MTKKPSEFNKSLDEHLIEKVAHILYNARVKCLNMDMNQKMVIPHGQMA